MLAHSAVLVSFAAPYSEAARDAGLPPLPDVGIGLHRRKGQLSPAALRLVEFIAESLDGRAQ